MSHVGGRASFARGGILIMTLVFVMMFTAIFIGLADLVSRQYKHGALQARDETAFQIAEAGLNYARWRLAHSPDNFESETREIEDQFAGVLGSYNVTFEEPQSGSTVVVITSVGATGARPEKEVTLMARYGIPSLARYSSIVNEDVWYGGEVSGALHANGGIRMDGYSDGIVTSARETYICKPYHGCWYQEKPGVWGSGERQELWEFPVPAVDYNALTADLLSMKSAAQENGTYHGHSGSNGYHVVFGDDNRYSLYRVTRMGDYMLSWSLQDGWRIMSHDISRQSHIGTYDVPSGGILYFEDRVWVDGDIRDRVTVAAGRFPDSPSTNVDVIINGDISYGGVKDGSRSFAAIAQRNIVLPYSGAPDYLELDGAYIAQKGIFGRRYYFYGSHRLKETITRFGMMASNGIPVTTWVDGSGSVVSGYKRGTSSYDPNLLYLPPPYFPTSGQYEFISWEQVE